MIASVLAAQDRDLGFKTGVEISYFVESVVVRVIGLVVAMIVLCVGSWAHYQYYAIVAELKNNHGLPAEDTYGPSDSVWGYFDFVWESFDSDSDSLIHSPRSAVASGVQTNPHLVSKE